MRDDPRTLVSTGWLARHLGAPDLRVLDGTWHMPDSGRDARAEYEAAHIPGARFFDIDEVSDPSSPLPHMAPAPEAFAQRMGALGIGDGDRVVVYDAHGLMSAARVWWLMRAMGVATVAVLDGGLPRWRAEGRPVEDAPPATQARRLTARRQDDLIADAAAVGRAIEGHGPQIVDARAAARFEGGAPEPRAGLRPGHMPGARNVPFGTLLNPDGTMRPEDALRAVFEAAGVDIDRPAITTCGSGVTAAVLTLALARIGAPDGALYDGSWSEWGAGAARPVATGPA